MRPKILQFLIIVSIIMTLFIFVNNCSESKTTNLMKSYQSTTQHEELLDEAVRLIQFQKNAQSEIFKLKYQKDLIKLNRLIKDTQYQYNVIHKKIANELQQNKSSYSNLTKRTFNQKIQVGLSIENNFYKTAFLNQLMFKNSIIAARVKDVQSFSNVMKVSTHIHILPKQISTQKILIIYADLFTKNIKLIPKIRKFSDIKANVIFKKYKITEVENFIYIHLVGNIVNLENIGFLGFSAWSSQESFLPIPSKFQTNYTLTSSGKIGKKKESLIKDLLLNNKTIIKTSKKENKKIKKKNPQKEEKTKSTPQKTTSPQRQWADDDEED